MAEKKKHNVTEKVKRHILELIVSGFYAPGAKIAPVRELVKRLEISHVSVAKAIGELVAEGVLDSQVGSGTFVSANFDFAKYADRAVRYEENGHRHLYFFFAHGSEDGVDSYHAEILCLIQQAAEARRWKLLIKLLDGESFLAVADDPDAVGVILANVPDLPALPVPVITYGMSPFPGSPCCVTPDNYMAGFDAARLLRQRKFAAVHFVSTFEDPVSPGNVLHFNERRSGFYDGCKKFGVALAPELSWSILTHTKPVMNRLLEITKTPRPFFPFLLVIGNRAMALEITGFAISLGLKIPEELAVLTFIRRGGRENMYPIDVFDFSRKEMADSCLELLDRALAGKSLPARIQLPMLYYPEGSFPAQ